MDFAPWEYRECELCHRTYVYPTHADAHFDRFHTEPPVVTEEERMARVLSDSDIWGGP